MKKKLLGVYKLPQIDNSDMVEPKLEIYEDRIELVLGRSASIDEAEFVKGHLTATCHINFCRKKFDFRDLILMNETLNKIMREKV